VVVFLATWGGGKIIRIVRGMLSGALGGINTGMAAAANLPNADANDNDNA